MVSGIPWFLPGVLCAIVVTAIAAPWVGRTLGVGRATALLLVFSLGVILSATVTPIGPAVEGGSLDRSCDFSRMGVAPLHELLTLGDTSLNVLLFVPLGWAMALVKDPARRRLLLLAGLALPFAIETLQRWAPILARGCESADVIDNLTGLAVGFAGATVVRWLLEAMTPADGADSA